MEKEVNLKINGMDVRLNPFVQKAFSGAIEGLVSSLKGLPSDIWKIEVTIQKKPKEGEI